MADSDSVVQRLWNEMERIDDAHRGKPGPITISRLEWTVILGFSAAASLAEEKAMTAAVIDQPNVVIRDGDDGGIVTVPYDFSNTQVSAIAIDFVSHANTPDVLRVENPDGSHRASAYLQPNKTVRFEWAEEPEPKGHSERTMPPMDTGASPAGGTHEPAIPRPSDI